MRHPSTVLAAAALTAFATGVLYGNATRTGNNKADFISAAQAKPLAYPGFEHVMCDVRGNNQTLFEVVLSDNGNARQDLLTREVNDGITEEVTVGTVQSVRDTIIQSTDLCRAAFRTAGKAYGVKPTLGYYTDPYLTGRLNRADISMYVPSKLGQQPQ